MNPQNSPEEFAEYGIILDAMLKESHRGGVLLGAALLDEYLKRLVQNFLVTPNSKKADEEIFGTQGFLNSFSSRTKLSYRLGLISKDESHDLDIIRDIRNKFAHRLLDATFEDQSISAKCSNLISSKRISDTTGFGQGAASKFQIAVALLGSQIALRALHIKDERRSEAKPFTLGQVIRSE